jgi:hypothetical protein
MSSIEELPPDQRAALTVLLRQGKTHEQVAGMLGIAPQAVHDRAHAALAVLAPAQARGLDAGQREEIGEYLLGQQHDAGERLRTRTLLASSPPAGEWARALTAQLETLAPGAPAEVPPPAGTAEPPRVEAPQAGYPLAQASSAPASQEPARPSSRIGGALLLAAIVAAVVVVIVVVTDSGSSKSKRTSTTSTTAATKPKAEGRIALHPPSPASHSTGTVQILSESGKKAFFIQAEHIPANTGKDFYAVWLYNSPSSALALSKSPRVGASHKLAGAALLPNNAADYHEILLTRETSTRPSRPGPVVLRGVLGL